MPLFPRLGAAVALLTLLVGCDQPVYGCTEIGCSDGYSVGIAAADRFPDGLYDLSVVAGGETDACAFRVEAGRVTDDETCNAAYGIGPSSPTPEAVGVSYGVIEGEISITLSRDGTVLHQVTTTPVYEHLQPNGPDCGPVCRVARTTLAIE